MITLIIFISLEILLLALAANWLWHSFHLQEGPFIPSRPHMIRRVAETIMVQDGQSFCELGCGSAEITARLAKRHPKANFVGFDKNILAVLIAKLRTCRLPNVTIKRANINHQDWSGYDWFYSFLLPPQMAVIEKKFLAEAKPEAILLSYIFYCPNLKPFKTDVSRKESLYFYRRP